MTEFLHGGDGEYTRPSKSQRKREMLALQKIGERLIDLRAEQLARLALPEELAEAVRFYHALKDKEARRRHLQFIGTVMRKIDATPIEDALNSLDQVHVRDTEDFHLVEQWRDSLVDGDDDLAGSLAERFGLELSQLRSLIRQAAGEKASGKPSKQGRALFRLLRRCLENETTDSVQDSV